MTQATVSSAVQSQRARNRATPARRTRPEPPDLELMEPPVGIPAEVPWALSRGRWIHHEAPQSADLPELMAFRQAVHVVDAGRL